MGMKVKKTAHAGAPNQGYLGHFNKQKFLDEGHNNILDFFKKALQFSTGPLGRIGGSRLDPLEGFKPEKDKNLNAEQQAAQKRLARRGAARRRRGEHR